MFRDMNDSDRRFHATWRAASGRPDGRWRVCRQFFAPLAPAPGSPHFQEARGPGGKLRLFASHGAADRAARKLESGQ